MAKVVTHEQQPAKDLSNRLALLGNTKQEVPHDHGMPLQSGSPQTRYGIGIKFGIDTENRCIFDHCLRNDESVKRIAVVER
jgi:hypothetical protein